MIIEFNGEEIDEWKDLPLVVANTPVETKAKIIVIRDGKKKSFKISIGRLDDPELVATAKPEENGIEAFGLRAQDLTPALADQLGLDQADGVIITDVDPSGSAAEAGIRRGDIIVELDRKAVKNANDLSKRLKASKDGALVLVRRGEATLFVPLKRQG